MNWIFLLVIIIVVCVIVFIILRNVLIGSRNLVDAAFADIDALLLKRYELIPKLVQIAKGYAEHESTLLEEIANKRLDVFHLGDSLQQTRSKIQLIKEAYPELKADSNFERLMNQITETENQLLYSRQFYNGTVESFNRKIESIPYSFFSAQLGFTKKKYIEVDSSEYQIPNTDV